MGLWVFFSAQKLLSFVFVFRRAICLVLYTRAFLQGLADRSLALLHIAFVFFAFVFFFYFRISFKILIFSQALINFNFSSTSVVTLRRLKRFRTAVLKRFVENESRSTARVLKINGEGQTTRNIGRIFFSTNRRAPRTFFFLCCSCPASYYTPRHIYLYALPLSWPLK